MSTYCYRCPQQLTGGIDTFGSADQPICAICYLTEVEEWIDACLAADDAPDYKAEHQRALALMKYLAYQMRRSERYSTQWRRLKRKLKAAGMAEEGLYWSAKFCAAGPRTRERSGG